MSEAGDTVKVRWCGEVRDATVVRRFKNGKVRVEVMRGRWIGGRPGSSSGPVVVTVDPWNIVDPSVER